MGVWKKEHALNRKEYKRMPVHTGKDSKGCYARWGEHGKKYYYECNDKTSRERAKSRALQQGRAIKSQGTTTLSLKRRAQMPGGGFLGGLPQDPAAVEKEIMSYLYYKKDIPPSTIKNMIDTWKERGIMPRSFNPAVVDNLTEKYFDEKFSQENLESDLESIDLLDSYKSDEIRERMDTLLEEYHATTDPKRKMELEQELTRMRRLLIHGRRRAIRRKYGRIDPYKSFV